MISFRRILAILWARFHKLVQLLKLANLLLAIALSATAPFQTPSIGYASAATEPTPAPEKSTQVSIEGEIVHPGNYGTSSARCLSDLLMLCGGMLPSASLHNMTIDRIELKARFKINVLTMVLHQDPTEDIELRPGDRGIVHNFSEEYSEPLAQVAFIRNQVLISGDVVSPGLLNMSFYAPKHFRIKELIQDAGGLRRFSDCI